MNYISDGIIKGACASGDRIYADITESGCYTVKKLCTANRNNG